MDDARRRELAGFLRSRRERITPGQVGLPVGGRRRTPGLRREEVAQLACVGVTWYTWLEQGRDIRASDQVLDAVAGTLRLGPDEREHLYRLAHGPSVGEPEPGSTPDVAALRPILAQLDPHPAVVHDARTDILACNRGYAWLMDVDSVPHGERNALLQYATNPEWRSRVEGWADRLPVVLAEFRSQMSRHPDDPRWRDLVDTLRRESDVVAALWDRHDVAPMRGHRKRFRHPDAGRLTFDFSHLWHGPAAELRLTVYTPADRHTDVATATHVPASARDVSPVRPGWSARPASG